MENTQFQDIGFIKNISLPPSSDSMRGYQCIPHVDVIDSIKDIIVAEGELKIYQFGNFSVILLFFNSL